jgi:glutamate synthase domain-containing protein 3
VADEMDNKIEIELLKKDVTTMTSLLEKFDTTIEKMQEIASNLSRMVSLQEQRLENQELATKEVQSILEMRRLEHNNNIKEVYNRINTVNRELTDKIEDTERTILAELHKMRDELKGEDKNIGFRLNQIELWKYMVMGVVGVGVFLLTKAIDILKIFH